MPHAITRIWLLRVLRLGDANSMHEAFARPIRLRKMAAVQGSREDVLAHDMGIFRPPDPVSTAAQKWQFAKRRLCDEDTSKQDFQFVETA